MKPSTEVMPYGLNLVGAEEVVIGKDQPEYLPLPALVRHNAEVITRWELSDEEIEDVLRTKNIYLRQFTGGQELQPQLPQTETEFLAAFGFQVAVEVKSALELFDKAQPVKPIDMILPCPRCGKLHVDAPEPENGWTNPPHKSHLCHGCGTIFRPADVPTNGVAQIKTRAEKDSPNNFVNTQTNGSTDA